MPDYSTTTKIMMTLAALASDGADPRPSGEARDQHAARIKQGIAAQLQDTALATQGQWSVTWVGLTEDDANLAYIAQGPNDRDGNSVYALVLRGTQMGDLMDQLEDLQVGQLHDFFSGGKPPTERQPKISKGAMEAFKEITAGTDLQQQLAKLKPHTLYVVGHSLGGAMATTVALYLQHQVSAGKLPIASIQPYTFAAPTSGDKVFADWFDQQFPNAVCTYNKYDLVPNAWATLWKLPLDPLIHQPFYPGPNDNPPGPGPTADLTNDIGVLLVAAAALTNGNTYVQPTRQPPLNNESPLQFLESYTAPATAPVQQFLEQVGYQHWSDTYLRLLNAPQVPPPAVPAVASVSPTSGNWGTKVTILPASGSTFTSDCVVDFGGFAAASQTVAPGGTSITAVAPLGFGAVDIRVTNMFGTSAAGSGDKFTFTF
ncbi:pimeloyl-ACP methyl ester carboxylesterase [Inquilinus ginsengisoli]|uniref:lipase family protein n=1 Tax=Inquilinus ginsengisoli TaxID=363840 RepID=UPI003D23E1C3